MKYDGTTYVSFISTHRNGIMGCTIFAIILFHQPFIGIFPFNAFHNYGYWGVEIFFFLVWGW